VLCRLLVDLPEDETTGEAFIHDRFPILVNVQRPGNGIPMATIFSVQPDGVTILRDLTLMMTRENGGMMGSQNVL